MLCLRAGSEEGGGAEEAGNPGWVDSALHTGLDFLPGAQCLCTALSRAGLSYDLAGNAGHASHPPAPNLPLPASESWISQLYNEQATSKAPYNLSNFLPPHCWPTARCLRRRSRVNVGFTRWLLPLVSLPSTLEAPSGLPAASTLYRLSLEGGRVTRRCPPDC